jgi:hypothetical protein
MGTLVAVLLAGALLIAWYFYIQGQKTDLAESQVSLQIRWAGAQDGCSEQQPLSVAITNDSERTVEKVEWAIEVKRPGHSNSLVKDTYNYAGGYESDRILEPGDRFGACYRVPELKDYAESTVGDLSGLEYSSLNKRITFSPR